VKILWRSPTLRTVAVYAASGLGFVGANLVLARALPTVEFGLLTLVTALVNLGFSLAPGGLDGVVLRRHVEAGPELLRRSAGAALFVSAVLVVVSKLAYDLSFLLVLMVFVSTMAGGIMLVAGAKFQSEQRFGISLALTQSPNLVLLLAALTVVLSNNREAYLPVSIVALGFVLAAAIGWWLLFRERAGKTADESRFSWGEAFSFAGLNAAGLVLLQLDRLVIPHVLSVHDLATYGVLAAIAGSLFRVLSMGVGYTLVPRLRAAEGASERRGLIAHEAKLVGGIVVGGAAVIWFATPLVERWLLAGKYHLAGSLVLAAVVTGTAKVLNSFGKSIVTALATPAELATVNVLGWVSVALAIPAAAFGARWGLAGVIYGVGLGWLLRAFTALYVTLGHLKLPTPVPDRPVTAAP
jgi:O-antigen/teichoic acid export membrane protein